MSTHSTTSQTSDSFLMSTSHESLSELARPSRPLLKDLAYQALKEQIVAGQLPAGTFLSERQLAARMEMSKTPIRAALERLETEGFVRVSPQQGIVVREMTIREIADQFELRMAIECYTVRALAGNMTPSQKERLQENLASQGTHTSADSRTEMVTLDTEFHMLLCEFLGNQEMLRVMSQIRDQMQRAIAVVTFENQSRAAESYEEHCEIAEALFSSDADTAVSRMWRHLEYGRQRILAPRAASATSHAV